MHEAVRTNGNNATPNAAIIEPKQSSADAPVFHVGSYERPTVRLSRRRPRQTSIPPQPEMMSPPLEIAPAKPEAFVFGTHPKDTEFRFNQTFSDPTGNVVFKTSDNVLFRVHDFYLKANSAVFRDMLSISNPTSSVESPLLITEKSRDFETILLIITGRPRDAIHRPDSWKQAVKLYRMMEKYQLDGHQPWFSEICALWLHEDPIDALFLACNRPSIDVVLARRVIADGFANATTDRLWDLEYCRQREPSSSDSEAKQSKARRKLLDPSNMTVRFGLDIGYKGLLAYNFTFAGLGSRENPEAWTALAVRFVETARKIEMEMSARR